MTMKNVPIAIGFAVITVSQLALGICLIIFAAKGGGKAILQILKDYISFRMPICFATIAHV